MDWTKEKHDIRLETVDPVHDEVKKMDWTVEKPTKSGWYWYRADKQDPQAVIVYISLGEIEWPDHSSSKIEKENGLWYGPLEPPHMVGWNIEDKENG